MNNQLNIPYKLYIPFPELINENYQYAIRTTQIGSSTYIIKVRTNLTSGGAPCDNTNSSASCMTYDIHYAMGTYTYSINSGQNSSTAFQSFALFPFDKITGDYVYSPMFKDSLLTFILFIGFIMFFILNLFKLIIRRR